MLVLIAIFLLVAEIVDPTVGIVLVALAGVFEVLEIWLWIKYLRRHRVRTGVEGMIGEKAIVVEPLDPQGTVRLRGEIWAARSADPAASGEKLRIKAVDGLTLEMER